MQVFDQTRERHLAFSIRRLPAQSFDQSQREITVTLFLQLVGAAADLGRVDGGEGLHFAVAHVEVEAAHVIFRERIIGCGAPRRRIVAASVQEQEHLADARLTNPVFDRHDVDRGLLQQVHVVAHLRIRRQQERLTVAFDAVPGEREEQQPIFRHDRREVRQTAQDVAARRLPLLRLIGRKQYDLIGGEASIAHK